MRHSWFVLIAAVALLGGCQSTPEQGPAPDESAGGGADAWNGGFSTDVEDGRLWVFRPGSKDLAEFERVGEPAKHVTRIGSGPLGLTVKAPDTEIMDEYLTAKPGFETRVRDGRLWVFRPGSEDLAEFERVGEPTKHVTRVAAGPRGMTIKAPDTRTIESYMAACAGFETHVVDGRIWVFRPGSEDLAEFERVGEPAKHVTRIKAGPLGMTVKAPDRATMTDYLRQVAD